MKKLLFVTLVTFFATPLFAQNDQIAPGLTKAELVTFLQNNYSVSNPLGYNSARDAMYGSIDNQNGNIVCVYTGFTITANTRGDAFSKGINTEHTWPQGKFNSDEPMRGDIHHLFPTVIEVNGDRSSFPFDEIPDNETDRWYINRDEQTAIPTTNIDEYSELLSGTAFEPREDHKGNVARAIFYFWAIYQNRSDVADDASFFNGMKEVLLTWHDADPVDAAEVARSLGAEQAQGNRNPFVHDTTLVRRAFFDGSVIEPDPVPNPVTGKIINIDASSFDIEYTVSNQSKSASFIYDTNLTATDPDGGSFIFSDYSMIERAEVSWEDDDEEMKANTVSVIMFEEKKDTVITGATASINALIITGILDATLSGGTPKAVELYATEDIPDLGVFGLGAANNGGGTDGVEFQFSGSIAKDSFIYIATESSNFGIWFDFTPDFVDNSNSSSVAINGDDALELFYDTTKAFSGNEIVVDTFGELNIDGTGTDWEYTDGWVYRKDFTGPDSSYFNISNWIFSGVDALENETSNSTATNPFPTGMYKPDVGTFIDNEDEVPLGISLYQNYPNPFNPSTQITYALDRPGFISLTVFDVTGREVIVLDQGQKLQGKHTVFFDASNVSSGVYIYRLQVGEFFVSGKMLLIK